MRVTTPVLWLAAAFWADKAVAGEVGFSLKLANGEVVEVELERNHGLLSPAYAVHRIDKHGKVVKVESEANRDCHFRGHVKGDKTSSVALSMCGGQMQGGVIHKGEKYEISQSANETQVRRVLSSTDRHVSFDQVLPQKVPQWIELPADSRVNPVAQRTSSLPTELFIEILLVSDAQRNEKFSTMSALEESNIAIMNQVATFYDRLKAGDVTIRVAVAGQIFWDDNVAIGSSNNANTILEKLNEWRRSQYDDLPSHDVMHLLSGRDFTGETIGLARLSSVCDDTSQCSNAPDGYCVSQGGRQLGCCSREAGAISEAPVTSPVLAAETVAHEIGHQLGMDHDGMDSASSCSPSNFLMAAVADVLPDASMTWSSCSVSAFTQFYNSRQTSYGYHMYGCLANRPGEVVTPGSGDDEGVDGAGSILAVPLTLVLAFLLPNA